MYRFLIADDEAIIREGIKHLLDYETLGFTVCGEASTGEQTYQLLMELRPDVALVDIRMPGISGLDAVKKARMEGYRGKIVIVSSFSDFRYAQEAIRSGVDNYITKPIDEDELAQIFRDYKAELEGSKPVSPASTPSLEALLLGKHLQTAALSQETYQVLVWQEFSPGLFSGEMRIPGLSKEEFESATLHQSHVILLKGKNAIRKFREITQTPNCRYLAPYFVTSSREVTLPELSEAFQNAKALHGRRFFCDPSTHLLNAGDPHAETSTVTKVCAQLLDEYTDKLLNYIQTFNRNLTASALAELRAILCSGSDTPDQIRLFMTDLYLQIKEHMNRRYPAGTISFFSNSSIIQQISSASFLDDIMGFLSERFDMIMSSTGTSTRDSVLDDVLHYIHHNYATNITLESIAPLFGYNHSYLGKIFRKKMGCSFNSYVDHVRIERAKELLLQDDAKVYAISEKVGYKNVDYFHVKFRKYVNQSPAEFRKTHRQG